MAVDHRPVQHFVWDREMIIVFPFQLTNTPKLFG
jgi:hypothetical protein